MRAAELLGQASVVIAGPDLAAIARRYLRPDATLADPVDGATARLLAAAEAIRKRGDRPGPVPLSGDAARAGLSRAGLSRPPLPEIGPSPAEAADLAVALLASIAEPVRTDRPR